MKKLLTNSLVVLLLAIIHSFLPMLHAQGTAFIYQGRLNYGTNPVTGTYVLTFTLFNTNSGGSIVAGPVTNSGVAVNNGLFTTTLDFGSTPYISGASLWLEVAAATNGSASFATLSPRQALMPTPYAVHAGSVNASSLIGQVTDANLATTFSSPHAFNNSGNSFTGNGSGLTALDASQLTSGTLADARLSSNVPLLNAGNTFSGSQNIFTGTIKSVGPVSANGYFGILEEDASGTGDFWILTKWDAVLNKRFSIYDGNGVTPIVLQERGGNVGIGTNAPNTRLQVVGTVSATSFTGDGSGLTGLNATNLTGTVQGGSLPANVAYVNAANTFSQQNIFTSTIKSVGPVSANGYFGFLQEDASHTGDFWILTKWDAALNKRFSIYDGNGVTPLVLQENGGNVGIGTNSPSSTLQVRGQVAATSLRSPGAGINTGTFAFTQMAVSTNTVNNYTTIFNPITDNDPNAILIITHNWTADTNSTTKYNTTPVGVYYDGTHWAIFNEDSSTMALGRAFNVMVIKN